MFFKNICVTECKGSCWKIEICSWCLIRCAFKSKRTPGTFHWMFMINSYRRIKYGYFVTAQHWFLSARRQIVPSICSWLWNQCVILSQLVKFWCVCVWVHVKWLGAKDLAQKTPEDLQWIGWKSCTAVEYIMICCFSFYLFLSWWRESSGKINPGHCVYCVNACSPVTH